MKLFNASNEEGTCLWCGEKLRHDYHVERRRTAKWNKPRTCSGCGEPYQPAPGGPWKLVDVVHGMFECGTCGAESYGARRERVVSRKQLTHTPGYAQSGRFCSLRCGYQFGVNRADWGHLLKPIEP